MGRYSSAAAALKVLHEQLEVQLPFIESKMPNLSSLELARVVQGGQRVIFTTAFNQYALADFRVDALNYSLKAYNHEEFLRAALNARTYFELETPWP